MITRKTWLGICGAAVLGLLVAGGYMATTAADFDSNKWKAQRGNPARDNPRAGMVGEVKELLRPGMTEAEVVALLGEPDGKKGNRYIYDLGMPGLRLDYEYFVIEFGSDGKLVKNWTEQG